MPLTIRNERRKEVQMRAESKIVKWLKAAGMRALKTFAEGALATIGTSAAFIHEVNWLMVLSGGAMAAVVSLLLSLKGLPELEE